MNSGGERPPAQAIPTDRQSPLRTLSRPQSSHAISGATSSNSLNEIRRNFSNIFGFEQGQPLEPQSSEFMPPVDQDNLRVLPTRLSHNADSDSSADTARENSIYLRNFCTTVVPESQEVHSSSTDLRSTVQSLMIFDRDYHLGKIMRKSFKTK